MSAYQPDMSDTSERLHQQLTSVEISCQQWINLYKRWNTFQLDFPRSRLETIYATWKKLLHLMSNLSSPDSMFFKIEDSVFARIRTILHNLREILGGFIKYGLINSEKDSIFSYNSAEEGVKAPSFYQCLLKSSASFVIYEIQQSRAADAILATPPAPTPL
jgi:hypothetical protein